MEASHKRSSISRELMKLALEELQNARDHIYLLPENEQPLTEEQILNRINAAITVLHQEVYRDANDTSQKRAGQQEPVAWRTFDGEGGYDYRSYEMNENYDKEWVERNPNHAHWVEPLYTSPQKQWVGLKDEEIVAATNAVHGFGAIKQKDMNFAKAIEAKLKEKNT